MGQNRNLFEEIFPSRAEKLIAFSGAGIVGLVAWFATLESNVVMVVASVALWFILWVSFKVLVIVIELSNANRLSGIKVRTNLSLLTLNTELPEVDTEGPKLATDVSLSICIWNLGKPTSCTVTLRSPGYLRLSILGAEGQASVVKRGNDCHIRKFELTRGELQIFTITKFALPMDLVTEYKETSQTLVIEVAEASTAAVPQVHEIHIAV